MNTIFISYKMHGPGAWRVSVIRDSFAVVLIPNAPEEWTPSCIIEGANEMPDKDLIAHPSVQEAAMIRLDQNNDFLVIIQF